MNYLSSIKRAQDKAWDYSVHRSVWYARERTGILFLMKLAAMKPGINFVAHALPVSCRSPHAREYVAYCCYVTSDGVVHEQYHECGKCPCLRYSKWEAEEELS